MAKEDERERALDTEFRLKFVGISELVPGPGKGGEGMGRGGRQEPTGIPSGALSGPHVTVDCDDHLMMSSAGRNYLQSSRAHLIPSRSLDSGMKSRSRLRTPRVPPPPLEIVSSQIRASF
ncbi:hypothetical protein Mp_3g24930 [Marchantia polymorpha subsp. ruderalis]|uniref:Uncharacterized protein n=2 Tax=Marchantia polymorpha TaxID=3197 RepID=A0AAF6B4I0_MARPO|nr:hypothetical protein MARPO_0100s0006 [Marchantia polymorpha]BBN06914.1 hypothetical protein Mp_3g24930 [Marchantia polymorpha subsp. ruderalis]|eukprot:PTQ32291.1 hypothetical protein MARPO_0100s0006 [Marchantia polymorpha]